MHEQRTREDSKMFDDGNGKIDIWRVENFKLVPQNRDLVGTFFGGDCYVILYTYQKNGKESYIIYYWLVRNKYFSISSLLELYEKYFNFKMLQSYSFSQV